MPDPSDVLVVFVTAPGEEQAIDIARALVDEKLAACANLVSGIRSVYSWKGEICDDPEVLMVIKTTRSRYPALQARVCEIHPYEVPEVIALPVVAGSEPYLAWVRKETVGSL